jgi:hypothetical protein
MRKKDTKDMQTNTAQPPLEEENNKLLSKNFREASYVVLFIAAVFVINAMETGSYRTPWPVAIITSLAGLGLFSYSWYLQTRKQ